MNYRYLLSRIAQAALVLWAAFTASFVLLQLLPGDAVLIKFLNPELGLGPQEIAEIRAAYGADHPVWQQYLHTLGQFLTGHFGYSLQAGVPVSQGLATNLPPTLRLAALGFTAAALLAVALAAAASLAPLAWLRNALLALPSVFVSVPVFWLGIMLIQVVSFRLGWIPVINPGPWEGLVLPTLTLAVPISAPLAQILLRNISGIFEGVLMSWVKAVEDRDPATAGHSHRVTALTLAMAREVNRTTTGPYADASFTQQQLEELRYAGLLHDIGKVYVRAEVFLKAKKLYNHHLKLIEE
ncbi:MAG: HD domain-containing protein, partial [Burkholderiaceae bacterium]